MNEILNTEGENLLEALHGKIVVKPETIKQACDPNIICGTVVSDNKAIRAKSNPLMTGTMCFFKKEEASLIQGLYVIDQRKIIARIKA